MYELDSSTIPPSGGQEDSVTEMGTGKDYSALGHLLGVVLCITLAPVFHSRVEA